MKKKKIVKVAIYARKSKYKEESDSVENQVKQCKEKIKYLNKFSDDTKYSLYKIYKDDGYSGGTIERPQFLKLLQDVEDNKFNLLVFYKLDRLSRSMIDTLRIVESMKEHKVDILSIKEDYINTTGAMGEAFFHITLVFAQLERTMASERIQDNARQLALAGKHLGGNTKYGFNYEKTKESDGKIRTVIKINEKEAKVVRHIFEYCLKTKESPGKIAAYMNENGITKPTYGREISTPLWEHWNVRTILENPVYAPNSLDVIDYLRGEGFEVLGPLGAFDGTTSLQFYDGKIFPYDVTPILKADDWIKVQKIVNIRRHFYSLDTGISNEKQLLTNGLAVCSACNRPLVSQIHRNSPKTYKYYVCRNKKCKDKYRVTYMDELDKKVIEEVKKVYNNKKTIEMLFEDDYKENKEDLKEKKIADKEKKLLKIKNRISNLMAIIEYWDHNEDEGFSNAIEDNMKKISTLYKSKDKLNDELIKLRKESREEKIKYNKKDFVESVEFFNTLLDEGYENNKEDLKIVLFYLLEKIVVNKNKEITIYYKFSTKISSFKL